MGRLRIDRLTGPPQPVRTSDGTVLVARCYRADTSLARLVGLLGTADLAPDEGLWLEPCASVHTVALRAPIGCAFIDSSGAVIGVVDPLRRWRAAGRRGARTVLECPAGVLADLPPGTRLRLGEGRS